MPAYVPGPLCVPRAEDPLVGQRALPAATDLVVALRSHGNEDPAVSTMVVNVPIERRPDWNGGFRSEVSFKSAG